MVADKSSPSGGIEKPPPSPCLEQDRPVNKAAGQVKKIAGQGTKVVSTGLVYGK